jgi:putative NADPH-quinone reductase
MKIVAINGSYVTNGIIDQVMAEFRQLAAQNQHTWIEYTLRETPIEFCKNCRQCTQAPGIGRGECVIPDGMAAMLDSVDQSDLLVLASPVNFFDVTAVMKRWTERLVCYAHWPWGQPGPAYRLKKSDKKAILVLSSAMPRHFVGWFTQAPKSLKRITTTIGAKPVKILKLGLQGQTARPQLSEKEKQRLSDSFQHITI